MKDIKITFTDCDTEETAESDSHHIPAYNSHEHHRSHVKLLQGGTLSTSHGHERHCHAGSNHAISKVWPTFLFVKFFQ